MQRRPLRSRLARPLGALGAAAAVAALALPATTTAASTEPTAASCAQIRAAARKGTAETVAFLFVTSGVLQVNPTCAYDLLTRKLQRRTTRAAFAAGKAVVVYRTRAPAKVTAQLTPRVRLDDQVGSWITLDAPDGKPHTFEIVLLKRDGRWLVDYWARAVGFQ